MVGIAFCGVPGCYTGEAGKRLTSMRKVRCWGAIACHEALHIGCIKVGYCLP